MQMGPLLPLSPHGLMNLLVITSRGSSVQAQNVLRDTDTLTGWDTEAHTETSRPTVYTHEDNMCKPYVVS